MRFPSHVRRFHILVVVVREAGNTVKRGDKRKCGPTRSAVTLEIELRCYRDGFLPLLYTGWFPEPVARCMRACTSRESSDRSYRSSSRPRAPLVFFLSKRGYWRVEVVRTYVMYIYRERIRG